MQVRQWSEVYRLVSLTASGLPRRGRRFDDRVVVLVFLWAAFNHRPVSWATMPRNYPAWMRRLLPRLPTSSTMSRRLRTDSVELFMSHLLDAAQGAPRLGLVRMLDGTALEIRGHSKDRQAGYGFGTGRKAKGYKLHVLLQAGGVIVDWRIAPMHISEKAMARRMLLGTDELMYVVADNYYDTKALHTIVSSKGGQMVVPRRPGTGPLRPGREAAGRLRSEAMLKGPSAFGRELLKSRMEIERFFGHADSHAQALGELPSWARTHRRVERWVHAKLIINAARINAARQAG